MMNAAVKINRDISSFFKKAGLTALIVTGVLFASKTLNGYVKVEPDQTYENCIVTTDYEYMGHGRGPYPVYKSKIYYVTVKQEVTEKNEISDHIEGEEYDIKNAFSINDNSISKKKEYLFNNIWGSDSESELQTLTVHIKMLRDKIEEDPKKPKHIITVWGVGYRYE